MSEAPGGACGGTIAKKAWVQLSPVYGVRHFNRACLALGDTDERSPTPNGGARVEEEVVHILGIGDRGDLQKAFEV